MISFLRVLQGVDIIYVSWWLALLISSDLCTEGDSIQSHGVLSFKGKSTFWREVAWWWFFEEGDEESGERRRSVFGWWRVVVELKGNELVFSMRLSSFSCLCLFIRMARGG